jgi:hypothetical protein
MGQRGLLLLALLTCSCATTLSARARKVQEVSDSPELVQRCVFLGSVQGQSTLGGMYQATAAANAHNDALEQAADMGATHIVWTEQAVGYSGATVRGKALNCEGPAQAPKQQKVPPTVTPVAAHREST